MVELLSSDDIERLRLAGAIASAILEALGRTLEPGMRTLDIDEATRRLCREQGVRSSQFGYQGFPGHVCTSRNAVVCHGIPGPERLECGDIVNVDVTIEHDGFHGDTSRTFLIGAVAPAARRLVAAAEAAMYAGIGAVRPGGRVGDIGAAIQAHAEPLGYGVVREYCGHGIGRWMHMEPQIPHCGMRGRGRRLRPGMAFTVEPMINAGRPETVVEPDGWTVVTQDGELSAQFEHTVLVTHEGAEILTATPKSTRPAKPRCRQT